MGQGELDAERRYLNKWEMYKALQGEVIGPCHLPETALFSREALRRLLDTHGSVYVKGVASWGGQGISRVEVLGEGQSRQYVWTLQGEPPVTYATFLQLAELLVPVYEMSECIVQQAAPLVKYEDRSFDIRVHLQRELDGSWVHAGNVVRVSGADSIVSNVAISGGQVFPVEQVVGVVLGAEVASEERATWQAKLREVGIAICEQLDQYRIFHEVGIDLGVDGEGELWLIEVNTDDALGCPSHDLFAALPDQSAYHQITKRYQQRNIGMFQLFMDWLVDEDGEEL